MADRLNPEQYLDTALGVLAEGSDCHSALDELPVPIYTTDAEGAVTYWNRACIDFAGREPQLGQDRWCVTWKIYTTTGELLPHDKCPMAEAIRRQQIIRNQVAIAERPDGSRVAFRPYPTPLFKDDGSLKGAVNMLIDVTDEQSDSLHVQAARCRRLAGATYDRHTSQVLDDMADGFERIADDLAAGKMSKI
jgi:PAS domain S-box-containing protein